MPRTCFSFLFFLAATAIVQFPAFAAPFDIKGIDIDSSITDLESLFTSMGGECNIAWLPREVGRDQRLICHMAPCAEGKRNSIGNLESCYSYQPGSSLTVAGEDIDNVMAWKNEFANGIESISMKFHDEYNQPVSRRIIGAALEKKFGPPIQGDIERDPVSWESGIYTLELSVGPLRQGGSVYMKAKRDSTNPILDDI